MYCAKCGAELNDESVFCPKCGGRLLETPLKPSDYPVVGKKEGSRFVGCLQQGSAVLIIFVLLVWYLFH